MKYIRVVFALDDEDVDEFVSRTLHNFFWENAYNELQGFYTSAPYDTRDEATGESWEPEASHENYKDAIDASLEAKYGDADESYVD